MRGRTGFPVRIKSLSGLMNYDPKSESSGTDFIQDTDKSHDINQEDTVSIFPVIVSLMMAKRICLGIGFAFSI